MEKLYKLNWVVIFSLSFFASCSLNKSYQGFGGGFHFPQKLQSSMQSESSFKISNHSTDDENNLAIPEFVNSVQPQIIGKDVTRNSDKINGISKSISLKIWAYPSNVNSNNKQSITQSSMVKSFNETNKSDSKLRIRIIKYLGLLFTIVGGILLLSGLLDPIGGGGLAATSLLIVILGIVFLKSASRRRKRLNQNK